MNRYDKCVRCGSLPRSATPFLCGLCARDPATRQEVAMAEAMRPDDVIEQRRYVMDLYRWRGGWGARL